MRAVAAVILRQYRHDRLAFWLGLLAAAVPAIAGVLLLGVAGWFITAAGIAGLTGVFLNIFVPSALIRALAILRTAGRYGERMLTHNATFHYLSGLRTSLFKAMALRPVRGRRSALQLNRLTSDISALDGVYVRLAVPLAVALVVSLLVIAVWGLVTVSVLLAGVVFLALWVGLWGRAVLRPGAGAARKADAAGEAMRLRSADMVAGRRDLLVYGGLERVGETILSADARQVRVEHLTEQRSIRLSVLSSLIGQVLVAAMIAVVVLDAAEGLLTAPVAVGLVLAAVALPEIFGAVLPGLVKLPRMALAAERTGALLDAGAHEAGTVKAGTVKAGGGGLNSSGPGPVPVLSFDAAGFRYPGAEMDILENLSFDLHAGETLAVAGRSGCGKSTIAALASRLLVPGRGQIRLHGLDLDRVPHEVLRKKVTVISQRPYLFNDTIAANLRVANPAATDAELWVALAQAALANRISDSPAGLETVLGEGGLGLSGGEQRRLALARAFLTSPDLFILDEMTEGLDTATAADVLERFFSFRGKAAVLMIAHKRQELQAADQVLFMPRRRAEVAAE